MKNCGKWKMLFSQLNFFFVKNLRLLRILCFFLFTKSKISIGVIGDMKVFCSEDEDGSHVKHLILFIFHSSATLTYYVVG